MASVFTTSLWATVGVGRLLLLSCVTSSVSLQGAGGGLLFFVCLFHFVCFLLFAVGTELKIRTGWHSDSTLAFHVKVNEFGELQILVGRDLDSPFELKSRNFYISLDGQMSDDDFVYLAFSDIYSSWTSRTFHDTFDITVVLSSPRVPLSLLQLISWTVLSVIKLPLFTSTGLCPFKTAAKSTSKCLLYWETEEEGWLFGKYSDN